MTAAVVVVVVVVWGSCDMGRTRTSTAGVQRSAGYSCDGERGSC